MRRRQVVGLTLIALFLAFAGGTASRRWRGTTNSAGPTAQRQSGSSFATAREALLEQSLRAIADGERAAARDRWDPSYVSDLLGPDPLAHVDWVRSRTAWVPYRGVLRGPVGVLLDRQGNSLDRALLLASLLERAGHEVRLARSELPAARVRALLPSLLRARAALAVSSTVQTNPDWRDDLRLVAGDYRQDSVTLVRILEAGLDSATRMLDTLDARTEDQTARLRGLLPNGRGGAAPVEDDLVDALRDHWWVQRNENGRWLDLDVLGVAHGAGGLRPGATFAPDALDSALYQRVVVRLVTERVSGGALLEQRTLQREIRPSAVIGQPIVLDILPAGWHPGLMAAASDPAAGFRRAALDEREWHAVLRVGGEAEEVVISLGRSAVATDPGNPFGGLGQGIAGALHQEKDDLSAAWLEYETLVPGRPPTVIRRQLFDLVGPAVRVSKRPVRLTLNEERRLERSLALTRTTEILPLGSGVAPEFLLHLAAKAALGNRNLLRASGLPPAHTPAEAMETFARNAVPVPSHLYTLAAVRMPADPDADVFIDRPNILSRHAFLAPRQGRVMRLEGTDIVANDVAVAPGTTESAAVRRRQGVRDTNAEALLHGGQPIVGSVADGFVRSARWIAITSPDDKVLVGMLADIRQRILDDLAAGYVIIAPSSLAGATQPELAGWWRTDPNTGQTLGVSGTGWGQTLATVGSVVPVGACPTCERAFKHRVLLAYAVVEAWMFEFLWCSGALGGSGGSGKVARAGSSLDWLATPAWADEVEDRRAACVWESWRNALAAGLFYKASVVWGILMKQVKLWRLLRALPPAEAAAAGATPSAGGTTPGGTPRSSAPPECPPGGGAPRAATEESPPATAGGASEEPAVDPLGRTEAAETPGAPRSEPPSEPPPRAEPNSPAKPPPPAESAEPAPGSAPGKRPPFDEQWGDLPPMDPGHYTEQANGWAAKAPDAERAVGVEEGFAREAAAKAEQAKQEIAAAEANPPAPDDYDALQRLSDARMDVIMAQRAQQALARAQAALARIRTLVEQYRRLEALNEALIQARAEMREASERLAELVRSGKADFQGAEYGRWKAAFDRYNQALKEYSEAYRQAGTVSSAPRRASPGPGAGGTLPMADQPVPPAAGQPGGGTLPMPDRPAPPSPGGQQCVAANPPPGSPPPGSSPPGSPPPGSPPPGSPPPTPATDAQRRLGEAERALEAARADRDAVMRQMDNAVEKMFAEEAARGHAAVPPTREHSALLLRKIAAMKRVWRLEEEVSLARLEAQKLEQASAGAVPAPIGGDAPPQLPVLVGLGGMSAP